ncbi:4-hydroxyphenylpyruvate dioxygenase [Purpureocillium takamizusanense]|uniref:4-hydroxyphenylpyruvate dioxygenase n=1 Tax=Purpureocillium takamizusanense TaxID=2060973 RepID=A0A9Q8QD10_9HYPO|nr:4-hydroxyphenylpyruvate dioxygenase [Purpureocillium takamizusanense]UNI17143.1 4-hydroxyphenylpyruvate dioxygenase [Purpureocillium takamizusanense]
MAIKRAVCTMSLGRCFAGHSLVHKLDAASRHGFTGIELFYEDLVALARDMSVSSSGGSSGDTQADQLSAAASIRRLCADRALEIICLQPFTHYEGLLDRDLHARRVQEMRFWVRLAHALGTDLICLPSSFLAVSELTDDMATIADDLRVLADIGLASTPVIRFAYEALCWGTRVDTWEASWDVVERVARPNFGICLDTFNIAGRIYADPTAPSGRTHGCDAALAASLRRLVSTVERSKVFLVQLADAERLARPLDQTHLFHVAGQPPRMSWSRNARLFYGETAHGAYLPVKSVLDAIVRGLGYKGWLSFEVFNRRLADVDEDVPDKMARRAAISWEKMARDMHLETVAATGNNHVATDRERTQAML